MLVVVTFLVLIALWWAFRPEKLWVNQKVNEPAPFDASSEPQPVLTGRFAKSQQTSGRATIYRKPGGGEYLRLTDFVTPSGSDIHVLLARSENLTVSQDVTKDGHESIDCGPLKSNQGDQNYDLPAAGLDKYDAVVIYGKRSQTLFGSARLATF
jgi:Electron transfer DM13